MRSQGLLTDYFEATPDAVVVIDRTGQILFANSQVEPLLGYLPHELVGQAHDILLPARYRDRHTIYVERFLIEQKPRMMGRGLDLFAMRKDGSELKSEISLSPYQAPDGVGVIVALRDHATLHSSISILEHENTTLRDNLGRARIDFATLLAKAGNEAIEHEDALGVLALVSEELHHRLKNMLAMVVGITSQTLRSAQSLEEGRQAVLSRLIAMGNAQDLLLGKGHSGAHVSDVILTAIEAFDSKSIPRFSLITLPVEIGPEAILPLTLSLNELCTNAVKYGALSNKDGRVYISSSIDKSNQTFSLTWIEEGGPVVKEHMRRGFGTRLLEALASQLHAEMRLDYEPSGVHYQLSIPMALLRKLSDA